MNCQDLSDRVQSMMKAKQENNMIDCIGVVYTKNDIECHDPSDSIPFVSKIRQDKNMTNHTGAIYDKNDIKLL